MGLVDDDTSFHFRVREHLLGFSVCYTAGTRFAPTRPPADRFGSVKEGRRGGYYQ